MKAKYLQCINCSATYGLKNYYECNNCGGILDVKYDITSTYQSSILKQQFDLLPVDNDKVVTLGEGRTPQLKSKNLSNAFDLKSLSFKCEFINPSGSFKDRPVSIGISKAVEFGFKKVIVASSGNGAGSVAAYAAKANLKAFIVVPESTPEEKVTQAQYYGGIIIKVKGPYSKSFQFVHEVSQQFDLFNLTTTFINPYTVEGDKSVSYELYNDMQEKTPDYIFVPIGSGPLLVGIYKGFKEIQYFNPEIKIPKMIGVQAEGCSPIAEAFLKNKSFVNAAESPSTIATGIGDGLEGYEKDGTYTLETIIKSQGFSLYVNDQEIKEAQKLLAVEEGLFVEPSAATSIALLKKNIEKNQIDLNANIVVILTGHGLKDMKQIEKSYTDIPIINTFEEFKDRVVADKT